MRYSSHSAKHSMLTFASTAGLKVATRAALGYHKIQGESKAVRAYDAKRLTGPCLALYNRIASFSESSGLGARVDSVEESDEEDEPQTQLVEDSSSSSSSDSDSEDGSEPSGPIYLHIASNKLHRGKATDQLITACYKVLNTNYSLVDGQLPPSALKCLTCYRTVHEDLDFSEDE